MEILVPLTIQINKLEYKNKDAANNLIRYITRTRPNEDRRNELITYGTVWGNNFNKPIEHVIREFEYIQQQYGTTGSLMCHYCIHISPSAYEAINNDLSKLIDYSKECCEYLFNLGFQCCYAIHYSETERLHIHLAINTTNFNTGYKLRQFPAEIKKTIEIPLTKLYEKYTYNCSNFPTYY
ncbi:MAG: relaxase/mobilization nuclease domain-containing protein [Lachnospiraceae bacterium]|nr:relaxase/mobilization nuclease domain-containing protein [Lachnospiraceae bacterium]